MMKTNKYGYVRYGWSIKYHETRRLILSSRHTKIWSLFYLTYIALTENSFKKKKSLGKKGEMTTLME